MTETRPNTSSTSEAAGPDPAISGGRPLHLRALPDRRGRPLLRADHRPDRGKKQGIFFYPSFDFIGERSPSDDKSLKGTKKIDWAFEAGLGAGFRYDWLRAYATIRQGFNGYNGQIGDLGFEVVVPVGVALPGRLRPPRELGLRGLHEDLFRRHAEAAKGTLAKYKPDAGFKTAGLVGRVSYALTDRTRLHGQAAWDRLIGDAGDSPIVKAGAANQWMIGVGITYKFAFDLFR